ncbi:hypothetical protein CRUP_030267 [Coryphaenoides rupestris]|nr:hypothetical protein CRUP_030267 [Coryphaenoides rupestris]
MEVLVEFEYQALHDDELTLHPGDVIRGRCAGWRRRAGWRGEACVAGRGLFPDNFIKSAHRPLGPGLRGNIGGVSDGDFKAVISGRWRRGTRDRTESLHHGSEVLVEFEYQALHDDELTLHPGDVIVAVCRVEEEGWMEGELRGRRGLFPDNFIKELKKDSKEVEAKAEVKVEAKAESCQAQRREKTAGTVAHLVQRMSTIGLPTGGIQPSASRKKPRRRQCKVLFDYAPQNQDELELKVGELVDINEEVEQGWWSGSVNGKSGLFPSNFVKELEEEDTGDIAPKKVLGFGFGDIFREGL